MADQLDDEQVQERDVLLLADIIGIGRDEPEYLWIAKEAYNSDLPFGWQIFFDDEGKHFYFDPKTETSTTQHPCIGYYQELYQNFKEQDEEFRKHQEAQELAMGIKSEKTKTVVDEVTGEETVVTLAADDADADADADAALQDPDEAGDDDIVAKAKLLQAYSHDPNLASHYRRDMIESDKRSGEMLKTILRREEDLFLQKLKLYVSKKEESMRGPLVDMLDQYAENSQDSVNEVVKEIQEQFGAFKEQIMELTEAAKKASSEPTKGDARQSRLAKYSRNKVKANEDENKSPSPERSRPGTSATSGECEKCKESDEKVKALEAKIKDLEERRVVENASSEHPRQNPRTSKEIETHRPNESQKSETETQEINELRTKLAAANMKNRLQAEELQKIKTMLASSMVQEIPVEESRKHMEEMALEARKRDALGWDGEGSRPVTSATSRPGTTASVLSQIEGSRPGTSGSASTTATGFAERFTASGMSQEVMMQVLERVEGMSAKGEGPIHKIRTEVAELRAQVAQLTEELARARAHSDLVEEQNKTHVMSLTKLDAQKIEIERAKEHSEHMEFLAQQYADQVQNLQSMLRKLRDQVSASKLTVDADKAQAKQLSLTQGGGSAPVHGGKDAAKSQFSVRVRSSTILEVKRSTATLRSAINLLRVDFQQYAEGIFLPLARELQQGTLSLATSLASKSRDLRICTNSLNLSFASQRLLEDKLHHVYKVSFHTLAFLRETEDGEQGPKRNSFRHPQPRSLTMKLLNGFENKREILEIYDFEKVVSCVGQGFNDPVSVFQELTPFFARILNWDSACLVLTGGRFSRKEELLDGHLVKNEKDKNEHLPGIFEQAVEYVANIYVSEKEKLQLARQTEAYDLQLFMGYSEVLEEETMHYLGEESDDAIGLADMQKIFATSKQSSAQDSGQLSGKNSKDNSGKNSKENSQPASVENSRPASRASSNGRKEGMKNGSEVGDGVENGEKTSVKSSKASAVDSDEDIYEDDGEDDDGPDEGENEERPVFLPTFPVRSEGSVAKEGLRLLKKARNESEGRLNMKQSELERNGSDRVQRAKRLAQKGSRNELGELMQEPHKVLSLMIVKRDNGTQEKETALLKIVVLGAPAEKEDPKSEGSVKFTEDIDPSRYTLTQYFERKYLRETDVHLHLNDSSLGDLVWDTLGTDSSVVLLTCVSPCIDHFDTTVRDLRFACKSRKERPTTAARLERVKFRWQNQSAAWAFTLWKGAVADSVQIQLNNEIDALTHEMDEVKAENQDLKGKLKQMAHDGVEYFSDKDKEDSDEGEVEDTDVLVQQRHILEKAIGKELLKFKERQEGAVLQTVIAKMQYAQTRQQALTTQNKSLARMLKHETSRGANKNVAASRSHGAARSKFGRSKTAMGDLGPGLGESMMSAGVSGTLPSLTNGRGGQQAWGESTERASKKSKGGTL